MHDIKYISNGCRLEAPTVANGIEPTLVGSLPNKIPATKYLGHEDQFLGHEDQSVS